MVRLLLLALAAFVSSMASAQDLSVSLGPRWLSDGTSAGDDYASLGVSLAASAAIQTGTAFVPLLSLHSASFPVTRDGAEGSGYRLWGGSVGLRVEPFRNGPVVPYVRAGLGGGQRRFPTLRYPDVGGEVDEGRTYGTIDAEVGLGVTVHHASGLFGAIDASILQANEVLSGTEHAGVRVGLGYRL